MNRELGKLERDRRDGGEAVRIGCAKLGEPLVLNLYHLRSEISPRRVPRRVDTQDFNVNTLLVHFAYTPGPDFVDARPARSATTLPEQCLSLRDDTVGVHVDRLRTAATYPDFASPGCRARIFLPHNHASQGTTWGTTLSWL